MKFKSNKEFNEFVDLFISKKLPRNEWSHAAHLAICIWHLINFNKSEATELIRIRIKAYNQASNETKTISVGYHETITLFWINITDEFLKHNKERDYILANKFIGSKKFSSNYIFQFYSKDLLNSELAKFQKVTEDLCKISI